MSRNIDGFVYMSCFIGTIFGANWLLHHFGTICPPDSPCLIMVWHGVYSPSGVLAAGLSFTFRDLVQKKLGIGYTFISIIIGAIISAFLSPKLAIASFVAFFVSEMIDLAVYTPLQKRFYTAVICSNIVGVCVDSCIFLYLAFGSLKYLEGQIIGKLWMTVLILPLIWLIRKANRYFNFGIS